MDRLEPYGLKADLMRFPAYKLQTFFRKKSWYNEATELTDRRWEKIKEEVVSYVQHVCREQRIQERLSPYRPTVRALGEAYDRYFRANLADMGRPMPTLPEFINSSRMQDVLKSLKTFKTEGIAEQLARSVADAVPEIAAEWQHQCETILSALTPPLSSGISTVDGDARIHLATTWFS